MFTLGSTKLSFRYTLAAAHTLEIITNDLVLVGDPRPNGV